MKESRLKFCCLACVLFLLLPLTFSCNVMASENNELVPVTEHFSIGLKAQYFFGSHTSYEFGNPLPPYQELLSRLEFPLDSWWGGVELRLSYPRFSIGGEVLSNALSDVRGHMKDSDWDDGAAPALKTIYSESSCRLESSYIARVDMDLEISDWLGLPKWISLRPLVGFRYQNFHMMVHDGIQHTPFDGNPPEDLPGNSIRFKQTYWQYFTGLRSNIDVGKFTNLSDLKLLLQIDWAYVEGSNEDKHLKRAGNRFTYEKTYGEAWHGSIGIRKGLTRNLVLGLDLDYLQITTTGSHRLVNDTPGIDFRFTHGVRVWSEQKNISLSLEYKF